MKNSYWIGIFLVLLAAFISAISQVMLKKAACKNYINQIVEYINPLVIGGYALLLFTTLISVIALRYIPITLASTLESTGQIFVTILSFLLLKEAINKQKIIGMLIILVGFIIYFQ